VGYLARTLSAFYALLGGLLWVLSFDLHRHRVVLLYLGAAFVVFGIIAMWVDFKEGMPVFWRFTEAPIVVVFGTAIFLLSRRLQART
jgi:NADH:ubiquinone oxidoreductase subunit 6 (subunit J)